MKNKELAGSIEAENEIEPLVLDLADLLPDGSGEVVLLTEELPLGIAGEAALTAQGVSGDHVTAGGLDVTGHHYYSFENGITLFSQDELLIL
jgi:hypothetical protein